MRLPCVSIAPGWLRRIDVILCVDPDGSARESTREALVESGFDVETAGSIEQARELVDSKEVECLITEYDLPDGTGFDLVERVREAAPDAACVLFTEVGMADVDTESFEELVVEYLRKDTPNARAELVALVEHSLGARSQTAYPLPRDEDERITVLSRYATDTEALRTAFDRLTEVAAELFDVEYATVGLVDTHHEYFFSCHGSLVDRLDREDTVCTYTILDDGVMVVEDVAEDPRFENNDRLADLGIRFYAGIPLVTPEGHSIGSFCLLDDDPGTFSDRDRELLSMLADEAMDQLELRRLLREAEGGESDD